MSDSRINLNPTGPKDPVQFPVKPSPPPSTGGPAQSAAADLVALARQNFQERRFKNCLALTTAILKIDPENKEAQVIESWVRKDLDQDLEKARSLVHDAQTQNNRGLQERAEIVLRTVLQIDPHHESARALFDELIALPPVSQTAITLPFTTPIELGPEEPVPWERKQWRVVIGVVVLVLVSVAAWSLLGRDDSMFERIASSPASSGPSGVLDIRVDDGIQVLVNDEYRGTAPLQPLTLPPGIYRLKYQLGGIEVGAEQVEVGTGAVASNTLRSLVGRIELMVIPTLGVRLLVNNKEAKDVPPYLVLKPGTHQLHFSAPGYRSELTSITLAAGETRRIPVFLQPIAPVNVTSATTPPAPRVNTAVPPVATPNRAQPPQQVIIPAANGRLAISSAQPLEIYAGDTLVGSTPTTLDLPAGNHTLEYRYENLRRAASYEVRSGETTSATITFESTLNINAQPWAEVFIEGSQRSLGQTPLSGVRVTVGSVLIFRNPGFPEKRHRVNGRDTAVQIVFP